MSSEDITNNPESNSNSTSTPIPTPILTPNITTALNRQDDSSTNSLPSDFLTSSVPLPQPPENPANTVPSKTLWMGDLEAWWDEDFIVNLWSKLDKHVEVKVIKPKNNLLMHQLAKTNGQGTVNHSGYCFIEFDSPQLATDALLLNGTIIQDSNNKSFRLNWASAATLDSQIAQTPEYSLFVGDLSAGTTEAHLLALFQSHFSSIKTVRVMTDPSTGLSRCFGFVRFSSEDDRRNALVEMNGKWLGGRQIRVALATPKHQNMNYDNNSSNSNHSNINNSRNGNFNHNNHNNNHPNGQNQYQRNNMNNLHNHNLQNQHQMQMEQSMYVNTINGPIPAGPIGFYPPFNPNGRNNMNNNFNDLSNTTVFVGGLANGIPEDTLLALFEPFGSISNVKVPPGKGCGFIKYAKREDAENAIENMQGFIIGGSRVRLSWGRPSNKTFQRQIQQPHHMYHMNNSNMGNMPLMGNMNPMGFSGSAGSGNVNNNSNNNNNNSFNGSLSADSNDTIPNVAIFNGGTPGMVSRPMFDYNQAQHGNIPPSVIQNSQIPQQLESYSETTPQGTHATLVGIPAGMPPPFIYDPYFAGSSMISSGDENQLVNGPNGMMEVPKGIVPIHSISPQQYAIDQNGQYMYLPTQPFPEGSMVQSPTNAYDDSSSVVNENNNNTEISGSNTASNNNNE